MRWYRSSLVVSLELLTALSVTSRVLSLLRQHPGMVFHQDTACPLIAHESTDYIRHAESLPQPARSPNLFLIKHVGLAQTSTLTQCRFSGFSEPVTTAGGLCSALTFCLYPDVWLRNSTDIGPRELVLHCPIGLILYSLHFSLMTFHHTAPYFISPSVLNFFCLCI